MSKTPKTPPPAQQSSPGVTPGKGTDPSNCPPLTDWQAPARGGWWGGKK